MYPGTYAAQAPDRIAAAMTGTGETLSYADLERRSVQLAHVLYEAGHGPPIAHAADSPAEPHAR
jgi:fatty-acyl-CoA synthase